MCKAVIAFASVLYLYVPAVSSAVDFLLLVVIFASLLFFPSSSSLPVIVPPCAFVVSGMIKPFCLYRLMISACVVSGYWLNVVEYKYPRNQTHQIDPKTCEVERGIFGAYSSVRFRAFTLI